MNKQTLGERLISAIHEADVGRLQAVLQEGADPDWTGGNRIAPLHVAAGNYFDSGIELLLNAGANPNAADSNGRTPLHYVAGSIDDEAPLCYLLNAGADPAVVDTLRQTPLHKAAKEGNSGIVSALLERGVPIDWQDKSGRTALHLAASVYKEATVLALLRWGANPRLKDCRERTALHYAVRGNYREMTTALLGAGADGRAKDAKGFEPLELAAGPVHGWGMRSAVAMMESGIHFPAALLSNLLRNVVRRTSEIPGADALVESLLQRKVSVDNITPRDFHRLMSENRRSNAREETSSYRPQTLKTLRALVRLGCRLPAELLAELL